MNTWVVTVPSSCWSFLGNKLQKRRLKISSSTQRLFLENREFSWDDTRGAKPLHSLVPRNRAPVDTSYGRMHCLFPDLGMNTGCVAGDLDLSELDLFRGLTETCSVVFWWTVVWTQCVIQLWRESFCLFWYCEGRWPLFPACFCVFLRTLNQQLHRKFQWLSLNLSNTPSTRIHPEATLWHFSSTCNKFAWLLHKQGSEKPPTKTCNTGFLFIVPGPGMGKRFDLGATMGPKIWLGGGRGWVRNR